MPESAIKKTAPTIFGGVPQVFYDLIGRITPGAVLLGTMAIAFPKNDIIGTLRTVTSIAGPDGFKPSVFLITASFLLASYVIALLLGGVWFLIRDFILVWFSKWKVVEHELLKRPDKEDFLGTSKDFSTQMSMLYDQVHHNTPGCCGRIVKLRAEQHMCGVLFVGFAALIYPVSLSTLPAPAAWIVGIAGGVALGMTLYMDKRYYLALCNNFLMYLKDQEGKANQEKKQDITP